MPETTTNNQHLHDIAGIERNSIRTNNQLLEIIATGGGNGGGGLTPEQLEKLNSVQSGAEVNVRSDWSATTGDAFILNKPVIPELGETSTTAYRGDRGKTAYNHISRQDNPHNVTQQQVGLGNVDNTSDVDKPVSSAVTSALNTKADLIDGTVPTAQLPSYVDSVQEYDNLVSFPTTGLSNVVYLAMDTNKPYRWGGSSYVEISSAGVTLGETSATAYRGDRGAIAYNHTNRVDNPHNVTKAQVGLLNVDNTSDANKPVSNAMASALAGKQDTLAAGDNITIDGNIINATGGGGGVISRKVKFTPEELKGFRNSPLELIPRPGINKIINLLSVSIFVDFNTVAYNFGSSPTNLVNIRYMSESGTVMSQILTSASPTIRSNTKAIAKLGLMGFAPTGALAENHSVVLVNASGNPTVGDSDVYFIISYTVDDYN